MQCIAHSAESRVQAGLSCGRGVDTDSTLCSLPRSTLYTVPCILHTVYYTLCTLCTVHYILHTVHSVLYSTAPLYSVCCTVCSTGPCLCFVGSVQYSWCRPGSEPGLPGVVAGAASQCRDITASIRHDNLRVSALSYPPLDSETGWTGDFWSKIYLLKW